MAETTSVTPAAVTPAAVTPAEVAFHIAPVNKAPGLWEITPDDAGIRAVHSLSGQVFVGAMADFNKAMAI
jgi:hypothetical protein